MIFNHHIQRLTFKTSIVLLVVPVLLATANGQTRANSSDKKINIEIYGGENGNLHTDGSNLISILTDDTSSTFNLKFSQGFVWQLDKYMFFVDSLKKGKATLSLYRVKNGTEYLVKTKTYNVFVPKTVLNFNALNISPNISLGGFISGKVKLDTLKKLNSLSIDDNYKILTATFYVGQNDMTIATIKSKYFEKYLKEIWKRIVPNCTVTVDNIEFVDNLGNRYIYPKSISLLVVE